MRLIDADELRKCAIPCELHNGASTDLCVPLYQIDNASTVETDIEVATKDAYEQGYTDGWKERFGEPNERPQGEWIDDGGDFIFKRCSNCGKEAEWLDGGSQLLSNFCPNCGAKMGGEEP